MKPVVFALVSAGLFVGACESLPTEPVRPAASIEPEVTETAPVVAETIEDTGAETEADTVAEAPSQRSFIQFQKSTLVTSLVSDSLLNDDVALMGLVSGAREHCGLDWQPGFVSFINIANSQGLNLSDLADNHGYYQGAAKRALGDADYECSEADYIDLRAIDPY